MTAHAEHGPIVDTLIPPIEAARLAKVTTSTIYRWRAAGKLTLYKCGSRTVVRLADLTRLLAPTPAA